MFPFFRYAALLNTLLSFAVALLPDPARWVLPQLGLLILSTLLARTLRQHSQLQLPLWLTACVYSAASLVVPEPLSTPHALFDTALWWLLFLISWPPGGGRRRQMLERLRAQLRQWSRGMPLPG
jgi:hypothetical protein